jgi:hypothetical protein
MLLYFLKIYIFLKYFLIILSTIKKNSYNYYKIIFLKSNLLDKLLPYQLSDNYLLNKKHMKKMNNTFILFTDIVSFCELAEKYSDVIIYMILFDLYTKFDNVIKTCKYVKKIETIGDSYMVVGDLNNNGTKEEIINELLYLSFKFIDIAANLRTPSHKLKIRVGIHVGSVVIGILGFENPRLCIVGKAVNKASRIQNYAQSNTLLISEQVYEICKDIESHYLYDKFEDILLKNIGTVNLYLVNNNI